MFAFITATAGLRTRWLACVAAPALRGACAGVLVGVFAGASAMAQVVQPDDYQAIALNWARGAAAGAMPATAHPLSLEVSVGALDARLHLAPCGRVEAYLPPGARLWGRSRVGVRCVDGISKWNVSMPLTVRAMGVARVIRTQVAAGAILNQSDVVEAQVDWAEENAAVLLDPADWLGQVATRALTTGQTLRQGMVRAAQVFQPGAQVRVVAEGVGFQASSDAQALSAGVVGQSARVRMENGRIATGLVLDAHTVKIEL